MERRAVPGHAGAAGEVVPALGSDDPRQPTSAASARWTRRCARRRRDGAFAGDVGTAVGEARSSPRRARDATAARVVRLEAERIALAIAAIVPVVDPELVVLGGGMGATGISCSSPSSGSSQSISPFRPRIEVSVLGDESSLHGAWPPRCSHRPCSSRGGSEQGARR